jgi:hypothetical protein
MSEEKIDFNKFIRSNRKKKSEPRQVTVSKYQTFTRFDFGKLKTALDKCFLKSNEEFGIINLTYLEEENTARALFGLVGELTFRKVNYLSRKIDEYIMDGILKKTFLVEYFKQPDGNIGFFTYGDPKYFKKVQEKHKVGFDKPIEAELTEFGYEKTREVCLNFNTTLKSIRYEPNNHKYYGNTDSAAVENKRKHGGRKNLDYNAEIIKEILSNENILLDDFEGTIEINDPSVKNRKYVVEFKLSQKGTITLFLPELKLSSVSIDDIEFENKLYDVVKTTYKNIVGEEWLNSSSIETLSPEQAIIGFINGV